MRSKATGADEGSDRRLRLASYNIHRCVGGDGRHDPARVAKVIRQMDVDLLGLQEVDARFGRELETRQLDYLAQATGMKAVGGPTIFRTDGFYGNALLTRCPLLEVQRYDISFPGREPRGILEVELETAAGPLRIIITHLGLRPVERRFQVKKILQIVGSAPQGPVVVLGDLNEWFLFGRPARWLHRFFGRSPAPKTFPSALPVFALDRILVRPRQRLVRTEVWKSPEARQASDHLPLLAELSLERPPAADFSAAAESR